ncbi:MAG: hypothetical protein LAO20_16160 [Acidobacteriia bacterium]|nr:hypothetical protein [Terriglobia bacterium]
MLRYVVLTNRKRAIIALVHTVAFLIVAVITGMITVHPLHKGSSAGAWAIGAIYVLVTTALLILTAISGTARERIYFACCTTSAAFGLARQIFGDEQIHVAIYVRVIMLACAVVAGVVILRGHGTRQITASD